MCFSPAQSKAHKQLIINRSSWFHFHRFKIFLIGVCMCFVYHGNWTFRKQKTLLSPPWSTKTNCMVINDCHTEMFTSNAHVMSSIWESDMLDNISWWIQPVGETVEGTNAVNFLHFLTFRNQNLTTYIYYAFKKGFLFIWITKDFQMEELTRHADTERRAKICICWHINAVSQYSWEPEFI